MRTLARSLVAASTVLAGCGSLTTYQSAETLAPGRWQGMAALGGGVYRDAPQDSRTPVGAIELGVRRGLADGTDAGFKLYTFGAELSVRQRLYAGTWTWAALASVGGIKTARDVNAIPEAWLGQLRLGVVATRRTSRTIAWSVGAAATGSLWIPANGGSAHGEMLGVFGNLDWRFGTCWHLIPELSLHRTVGGDVPVDGGALMLGAAFARDW